MTAPTPDRHEQSKDIAGISATRGSAILGLNKWKTTVLAWQEIMEKRQPGFNAARGYTLPEPEEKSVFAWGKAFETAVFDLADERSPLDESSREQLYQSGSEPVAFGFIDARYEDGALAEIKTTNVRSFYQSWGEPGTDRIPQEYQVQVQHLMMITGASECCVSVLVFPRPIDEWEAMGWEMCEDGVDSAMFHAEQGWHSYPRDWAEYLEMMGYFHQYIVPADPALHEMMREKYAEFWAKYVLTAKEPPCADYEDVRRLFPEPKGSLVVHPTVELWTREYKDIGKELGASGHLKKRQEELKRLILSYARKKTTVADDDSQEKIVFLDSTGNKLGQFDGKTFRVN